MEQDCKEVPRAFIFMVPASLERASSLLTLSVETGRTLSHLKRNQDEEIALVACRIQMRDVSHSTGKSRVLLQVLPAPP